MVLSITGTVIKFTSLLKRVLKIHKKMEITSEREPEIEVEGSVVKKRLRQCILINAMLFACILCSIVALGNSENGYLRYGPGEGLQPLGIKIDNWRKYWIF